MRSAKDARIEALELQVKELTEALVKLASERPQVVYVPTLHPPTVWYGTDYGTIAPTPTVTYNTIASDTALGSVTVTA